MRSQYIRPNMVVRAPVVQHFWHAPNPTWSAWRNDYPREK